MKELNLENYGVVEMKQQEMVDTEGGNVISDLLKMAVADAIIDSPTEQMKVNSFLYDHLGL